MAHFEKYTGTAARGIVAHCKRESKTEKSYIDQTRTPLNYTKELCSVDKMIEHLGAYCLNRADVKKLASLCVSLPPDVKPEDMSKFFNSVTSFMIQESANHIKQTEEYNGKTYPKHSIIGKYVHLDETTPHMHLHFVPVVKDKEDGHLKVSAKEWLTRRYLQTFHDRLAKHVERDLGYKATVVAEKHADRLKSAQNVNIHVYRERKQAELGRIEASIKAKEKELESIEARIQQKTARTFSAFERSILDGDDRYDGYER